MTEDRIIYNIASDLKIKAHQGKATLHLLEEKNTIPFIARYRKEATGSLDEVQLRAVQERFEYESLLADRKKTVEQSIREQGLWTQDLSRSLEKATLLREVEDLYLPYKPKKRTKASAAREAGLAPFAERMIRQNQRDPSPERVAASYVNDTVLSTEDAINGALYIIAETLSENADCRQAIRKDLWKHAVLECSLNVDEDEAGPFATYKDYSERISLMPSHRILAVTRGESLKVLKVRLQADHEAHIERLSRQLITGPSPYTNLLKAAATDSYKRLIFPQLEREIRNELFERGEKQAITVFSENLRSLLMQPPFTQQTILGLDPGYRTGCKAAVIDPTGNVLDYGTCMLTGSEKQKSLAADTLTRFIKTYGVNLISIGNGTASYETEQFVSALIDDRKLPCSYIITNESGASVYSASDLARAELPDLDVTIRGAVSIARRIQDPLAEFIKIDPKSIGVGQYQHDVNQKKLTSALDDIVESVVNRVGVDLNTASQALLQHISGLTAATAGNIVAYRNTNGPFHSRKELKKIPRLGTATFTQCAGFLRIKDGDNPLDNTSVHPESYDLTKKIAAHYGFSLHDLKDEMHLDDLKKKVQESDAAILAPLLEAGEPTIRDIISELRKPGRDIRSDLPQPLTRKKLMSLDELQVGTVVKGTVQNVVDFGAFVDFGLKTAGLIHRSELSTRPFKHPLDIVHTGDIVEVQIIGVEAKKNRIALSIKALEKVKNRKPRH